MNDFLNDAREAIDKAAQKAAPVVEDVKDKVETAVSDLKEKAAPVVGKVKDGVADAVEAVKDGAEKIGDLFAPDAPGVNVKNALFDQLGEQVQAQKAAATSKAEEMQKKLEELMGKK